MVKNAVVKRIEELCMKQGISYTELARRAGMTPSTVYGVLKPDRKDTTIVTIKKICDGLDITLGEFFSTKEFDQLEQEIK